MKIRVTIEVPDYSLEELEQTSVEFLELDRAPDAVDMLMTVLDGALEISYVVHEQEAS